MRRAVLAWLIMAVWAVSAGGDHVVLKDGRSFDGIVTLSEDKVVIEHAYGTISFPASEVTSIQRGPTPAQQLETQLALIDRSDPDAVFQLAVWAADNDLSKQSNELLREVVQLDGDHAGARKMLGQVRDDGKWLALPAALQVAQGKLEAGKYEVLLNQLLPALEEVAKESKQRLLILHIRGHSQLRSRRFEQARKSFELLAGRSTPPDSIRYAAVAELLKKHADGMYVMSEPYPPVAMVLDGPGPAVASGPASLARPPVLAAGLRACAKDAIKAARAVMDEAKKLELTEPEAAKVKYALAEKHFDKADAIVPGIAHSYRVEIVRRRIAMITKSMNVEAGKYDALKAELGKRDLTPAQYGELIVGMVRALNRVRSDLNAILQLASPFERELVLEITDATHRLQGVNALREILMQELHGK